MLGEMKSEVFVANADDSGARNLTNHPAFDGFRLGRKPLAFASKNLDFGFDREILSRGLKVS
jgi:hypothetical protein